MQADHDAPTMTPSTPPPASPEPPQARRALPFWATAVLVLLLAASLGAIQGARIAFGAPLPEAAAPVETDPCGTLERDWRQGNLWRPVGSTATRPEPRLRPRVWRPIDTQVAERVLDREAL